VAEVVDIIIASINSKTLLLCCFCFAVCTCRHRCSNIVRGGPKYLYSCWATYSVR